VEIIISIEVIDIEKQENISTFFRPIDESANAARKVEPRKPIKKEDCGKPMMNVLAHSRFQCEIIGLFQLFHPMMTLVYFLAQYWNEIQVHHKFVLNFPLLLLINVCVCFYFVLVVWFYSLKENLKFTGNDNIMISNMQPALVIIKLIVQ
jgi:hypothetical protein